MAVDAQLERLPDGRPRLRWAEPTDRVYAVVEQRLRDGVRVDPVDRRGRLKADLIRLVATRPPARKVELRRRDGAVLDPSAWGRTLADSVSLPAVGTLKPAVTLNAAQWRFVTGASTRAWSRVVDQFGDDAPAVAMALVEAGVVELNVPVLPPARLDLAHPKGWYLTSGWAEHAANADAARTQAREKLTERACELAEKVEELDRGLADALRSTAAHSPVLAVLMAAASDLLDGTYHDGPRAFSQLHFGHTKAREDAPEVLRAAGVFEATLDALGLRRSPYVGLGGPLTINGWDARSWPGPIRMRADPHRTLAVLLGDARAVVLVENLQAAETVCDTYPEVALVWFAGQPANPVLRVCVDVTTQAVGRGMPVLVAPDADLGGARIAARVLHALPAAAKVQVVDAGMQAHQTRGPLSPTAVEALGRIATDSHGPHSAAVSRFAGAIRQRGYPVEQEAAIRAALANCLRW